MKPIGTFAMAALLGLAVWHAGPTLRATQQLAMAQEVQEIGFGIYQVTYFDVSSSFTKSQQGYGGPGHSGGVGDSLVRIVDVGNFEALVPPAQNDLCANIYVFDDDQEMQECCSCPLSPDSLKTISTINDLTSNPQFSSPLGVGVIKIVTSGYDNEGVICGSGGNGLPGTAGTLVPFVPPLEDGLEAWATHAESIASNNAGFTPPFGFVTSTSVDEFEHAPLDSGELRTLTTECLNAELHASGRGICTCGVGS